MYEVHIAEAWVKVEGKVLRYNVSGESLTVTLLKP